MLEYVIGVDGGGTKTHYALFDLQGNLLNFIEGGPGNHEAYTNGYEGARKELERSIFKLLKPDGMKPKDISYAVFGLAGVDIKKQQKELSKIIFEIGINDFKVFNDAFLGVKAGSEKGYGICSINGTGTCCAGIDRNGQWLQVGGTGFTFGDEAGSRYIGEIVIRKVYDSIFRCGRQTAMKEMLFKELEINEEDELVEAVYEKVYTDKVKITDLSRIAFYAASQADEAALELLRRSGMEMAASVVGTINRLDFSCEEEIDVVMAGTVNVKGENPVLVETFKQEVFRQVKGRVRFIILQAPPVAGAVLWAIEELNRSIDSEVRRKVIQNLTRV